VTTSSLLHHKGAPVWCIINIAPGFHSIRDCVRTIEVMNIPQPRDKRGLLSRFHNAPNERYKYLYTGQSSTRLSLPPPTYHQPPIAIVMEYSPSRHTAYLPIFGPDLCVYSRQTRFPRRHHTLTTFYLRRRVKSTNWNPRAGVTRVFSPAHRVKVSTHGLLFNREAYRPVSCPVPVSPATLLLQVFPTRYLRTGQCRQNRIKSIT